MKSPSHMFKNGFCDCSPYQALFWNWIGELPIMQNAFLIFFDSVTAANQVIEFMVIRYVNILKVPINTIPPAPIKAVLLTLVGEKQFFHSINIKQGNKTEAI
jgi:hypothetical protein